MSTSQPLNVGAPAASADPRLAKAMADIEAILVPGESIQATAVQRRLFALNHRRLVLAATSGRLLVMARGLFGGFRLTDVRWQDLKDANLKVGIFGSDLAVQALASQDMAVQEVASGRLVFQGLRKPDAERLYKVCQFNEQSWREKRRQRELEEMRAKAGGVQIGTPGAGGVAGAPPEDLVARLEHAKEMLQKGLITDSEYEAIKAKVLGTL